MSDNAKGRTCEAVVLDSAFLDPNSKKKSGDGTGDVAGPGDGTGPDDLDPVLIILNHNLPRLTAALWRRARLVVVADGGADRLLEASRGWEEAFGSSPSSPSSSSSWRRPPRRSGDDDGGGGGGGPSPSPPPPSSSFLPDFVVGDLDSISPRARLHFGALGVPIVDLSEDQDSTDLQKCLAFAAAEVERQERRRRERGPPSPLAPPPPPSSSPSPSSSSLPPAPHPPPVFVAGALGGRLDHSLSAISTLYAIDAARGRRRRRRKTEGEGEGEEEEGGEERGFAAAAARSLGGVVLAGDGSLARLVPSSSSSPSSEPSESSRLRQMVTILPCAAVEGPGCGLVALGSPATGVETSGLEWNLSAAAAEGGEGPALEMGGLQSTSNSIAEGNVVTVRSSAPLLWTTTLREEWR